jgi:uncharacterized protein YdhG (YjbR/CyaY superfamily)
MRMAIRDNADSWVASRERAVSFERESAEERNMAKYATVDDYMADLPEDRRAVMQTLRRTMAEAAPQATETIAYNMPALRLNGKFLISYEAFKNHYSVFPWTDRMAEELGDELKPYVHGKGTLRFPAGESIPVDLVTRIMRIRLDEVGGEHAEPPRS